MSFIAEWESEHANRLMLGDKPLDPVFAFFEPLKNTAMTVLDIGCGAGTNAIWLSKNAFHVWGFDSSSSAVARLLYAATATHHHNMPHVVIADATKPWPYASHSFDIALDVRVLENLDEESVVYACKQIGRVLKQNGMFFCLTASERRPDHYTTCGKVRKSSDMEIYTWLTVAGMALTEKPRIEFPDTLRDWCITAKRV